MKQLKDDYEMTQHQSPVGSVSAARVSVSASLGLSDSSRRFLLGLGEASPRNFARNRIHENDHLRPISRRTTRQHLTKEQPTPNHCHNSGITTNAAETFAFLK